MQEVADPETVRAEALERTGILNIPGDAGLEELAELAAEVCQTPLAAVSFLDRDFQTFKGNVGFRQSDYPIETAVCQATLQARETTIIRDLAADERFVDQTYPDDEALRFYAGVPLFTTGDIAIGALCVADYRPRDLDRPVVRMLEILAGQAMRRVELEQALEANRARLAETQLLETKYRRIVDSAVDFGIISLDLNWRILSFNTGAERLTGWPEAEVIGRPITLLYPEGADEEGLAAEIASARTEEAEDRRYVRCDGSVFWATGETMRLRTDEDSHVGYLKILRDRTVRHEAEEQREELMREMAHRMKNVLASVQSIVAQSLRTSRSTREAQEAIGSRIQALARAQDILTRASWMGADIHRVVRDALVAHFTEDDPRLDLDGPDLHLSSQQVLGLSLAVHELATNASKYGALSAEEGRVSIAWTHDAGTNAFDLVWKESGGPHVNQPERVGYGSRLVQRIVGAYFGGTGELHFEPDGVRFALSGIVRPDDNYR